VISAVPVRGCAFNNIKHMGSGQFYLFATRDSKGQPLDGALCYRLTVPPKVPVKHYWSATAYDRTTHDLIPDVGWASRSSLTENLQVNEDGSTDIWFGPKAPAGKVANWVPTKPGGSFEVLFRLYGPEKPLFDKTWRLPDLEKTRSLPRRPRIRPCAEHNAPAQGFTTMSDFAADRIFSGPIPKLYETYLVPLIFEPYAIDLSERVAARPVRRVLEIAAGTGVVTRRLAARLPASASIVATDLNQPMLDQAAAVGTGPPRDLAGGGRDGTPVPGRVVRRRRLPVRRHVLSRQGQGIRRDGTACSSRADGSCSMRGIASKRTTSPTK
jgi:hypothetical protein